MRQLAWAVLASLALHALLLFALPVLQDIRKNNPIRTLTARLAEPPPAAPAPPKQEPPLQPREELPRKRVAAPRPAPVPAPQPAPVLSAEPSKPAAEPVATVAPPVVAPPPATPAPATVAKAEPPRAAVSTASPEAESLAQYRMEILELARRYKRYPRVAQDNNWTGTSSVRMVIGADGAIESLVVRTSAGYAVLDQEAMAMLRTAKGKATIPAALRGKTITLDVPVIFNIKDD